MTRSAELTARALEWIRGDPDPVTVAELKGVLEDEADASLEERMIPLEFGTAGLRGVVGAGPGRMNAAVVRRVTRAVADFVLDRAGSISSCTVVVGFDGRTDSRRYAREAARVLDAAGVHVRYFDEPVPTPLVAFAALEERASAAVVITASHNGAEYNGYKVYGADGIQILTPHDADIADRARRVAPANLIPVSDEFFGAGERSRELLTLDVFDRYFTEVSKLRDSALPPAPLKIVYTPLHGVGWALMRDLMGRAGYGDVHVVPDQARPDGRFPTTPLPNPEEAGVLDEAFALAERLRADIVIANDPDADRLAVGVPDPAGGFLQLTGNQVGLLLADDLLSRTAHPRPAVVSTVVSSPMLESVAGSHEAHVERTLTGFKWVCSAAQELERGGLGVVLGYEEALGYCPGHVVRDKDGLSSALLVADLASRCRARKTNLLQHLHHLYVEHGLWVSAASSAVCAGPGGQDRIAQGMEVLAQSPPSHVGGRRVEEVEDFRLGAERRPPWQPSTALVLFGLEGGGRIVVRPSGTEPKLKVYVDLHVAPDATLNVAEQERQAKDQAARLAQSLLVVAGLDNA